MFSGFLPKQNEFVVVWKKKDTLEARFLIQQRGSSSSKKTEETREVNVSLDWISESMKNIIRTNSET